MKKEIEIPEGYDARIEGNKIIIEPKESKDERIRKMILEQMERWKKCAEDNNVEQDVEDASDAIAYLEKHKEQNLVEWSEEDEKKLRSVISLMRVSPSVVPLYDKMCLEGWLESLPERFNPKSHWKPSEEQMDALRRVTYKMGNSCFGKSWANDENLHSLYIALKQLM